MASRSFSVHIKNGPQPLSDQGGGDANTKQLYEVAFAMRAMMLMRKLLGNKGIDELFKDEIVSSNAFWRDAVVRSDGNWVPARIKLSTRGINAQQFIAWFSSGGSVVPPEVVVSHPEHWAIYVDQEKGAPYVFETIGDKSTRFYNKTDGTAAAFVDDDPDLPMKMTGQGCLYGGDQVHIMEVRMTVECGMIQVVYLASEEGTNPVSLVMMLEGNTKISPRSIISSEIMRMAADLRLILQCIFLHLLETTSSRPIANTWWWSSATGFVTRIWLLW